MKNIFSASWRFIKKHVTLMRILVISFLFIMIFVDENSFVQSFLYDQQIHGLKKEIQHYQGVIEESKTKLNELQSNEKNLEKRKQEEENRQSWNHHSLPDPDDGAGRCNQQCYG